MISIYEQMIVRHLEPKKLEIIKIKAHMDMRVGSFLNGNPQDSLKQRKGTTDSILGLKIRFRKIWIYIRHV